MLGCLVIVVYHCSCIEDEVLHLLFELFMKIYIYSVINFMNSTIHKIINWKIFPDYSIYCTYTHTHYMAYSMVGITLQIYVQHDN